MGWTEEIVLRPGFSAIYGSKFCARIEPCESCEEEIRNDGEEDENAHAEHIVAELSEQTLDPFMAEDTIVAMRPTGLRMYPNPASGVLTIPFDEGIDEIKLYDATGRRVYRWYVASRDCGETVLDVKDLKSGVYLLQIIINQNSILVGRFVKE